MGRRFEAVWPAWARSVSVFPVLGGVFAVLGGSLCPAVAQAAPVLERCPDNTVVSATDACAAVERDGASKIGVRPQAGAEEILREVMAEATSRAEGRSFKVAPPPRRLTRAEGAGT